METKHEKYNRLFTAVTSGEMTFDSFFRETKSDWMRIASAYYAKGQRANWYSVEDCLQDCCVGVVQAFSKYDPKVCNGGGNFYGFITQQAAFWMGKQLLKIRTGRASWSSYQVSECIKETALPETYDVAIEHGDFSKSETILDIARGKDLKSRLLLQSLLRTGDLQETKNELTKQNRNLFRSVSEVTRCLSKLVEAQNV